MRASALALALFCGCAAATKAAPPADSVPSALEQARGKVVLLDYFATWCEPCKASLPAAQRLAAELSPQGLRAFAVNVEASADAQGFLRDLRVALPLLRDPDGVQAEAMGCKNLPFAVLVDRKGQVRYRREGLADDAEERLRDEARRLLAEP